MVLFTGGLVARQLGLPKPMEREMFVITPCLAIVMPEACAAQAKNL